MVTADREVRIFVSSTFEDFRAERKVLLQKVVPELNRRAQERDIYVSAVDLQWGVSEADARDNLQLATCLREIERCSPFLIGLLGERYGWCPPAAALENARASNSWRGLSITEMEIRSALLPNYWVNRSGLVYAKKSYEAVRKRRQGLAKAVARLPTREAQLGLLRGHGLYVGATNDTSGRYIKPRPRHHSKRPFENLVLDLIDRGAAVHLLEHDFEQRVVEDAWALIDKHFPADQDFNPASRFVRRHRHFGFAQTLAFDPNWPTLKVLADAARRMEPMQAGFSNSWEATGVAGILAREAREALGNARVLEFHCGLGRRQSLPEELLGALLAFLGATLDQRGAVPSGNTARLAMLERMLEAEGAAKAPAIIVISESELLRDAGSDVLSLLRNATLTRLIETRTGGGAETEWLEEERRLFLERTIRRRGRALDDAHMERVVAHPLSTNLLFMQFVSAFLAHWADYQTLGNELSRALSASTWEEVADLVRLGRDMADNPVNEAVRVLASKLVGSPDGVDPANLVREPALNGRALFEARSRMTFLITEWAGSWRLGRGAETVARALMS
ncbi:MAG: DUF4062 domain-containing protein [Hyphomonadaceae bacterium]|nr:DUF4062 domain-containing protein [Hyphomonadaceae bacterium]